MMGFWLFTENEGLGALNLCSHRPGAFTEAGEVAGRLPASHAAVAFSSARTDAQAHGQNPRRPRPRDRLRSAHRWSGYARLTCSMSDSTSAATRRSETRPAYMASRSSARRTAEG